MLGSLGSPTTHVRFVVDASRPGNGRRVSGILHTTVSRRGGFRLPAAKNESKSKNPSRSKEIRLTAPGWVFASRDAETLDPGRSAARRVDSALLPGRRGPDRRGQARKGAGGMPRRHQRFERGRPR